MSGKARKATIPEVARLLGTSEQEVLDKIERGQLRAEREGQRWLVLLPPDAPLNGESGGDSAQAPVSEREQAAPHASPHFNADRYNAELRAMMLEMRQAYEGQVIAQRETISELRARVAEKNEAIAELRRRAEAAEAERDDLRRRSPEKAARSPARIPARAPSEPLATAAPEPFMPTPRPWWRRIFGESE